LISTSYSHVSSSFFIIRFQGNIEEILVTPISNCILLLSFVLSGIIRGLLVASLLGLIIVGVFHLPLHLNLKALTVAVEISAIFALIGFSNGYYAKDFDEIAFIPSFILTPLSYLAGVFYSLDMLSPQWQALSSYNPLVYIIQSFRAECLNLNYDLTTITQMSMGICIIFLFSFNLSIMRHGMLLKK
jgi:ABC-2 type transport system permease protein